MTEQAGGSADPYDLGESQPTPTPPAEPEPAARPRNPDGTFASQPKVPDRLLKSARDLGIPEEEIVTMTPAELRAEIAAARMEQLVNQRAQTVETAISRTSSAPEPVVSQPTSDIPDLDPAEFDGKLVALVKALKARIEVLEGSVGEVKTYAANQQQKTLADECDAFFNRHAAVFGQGNYGDIDQEGPEFAKRMATISLAKTLNPKLSVTARLEKARATLFGAATAPAPEPAKKKGTVFTEEEWNNGGLARPTQRNGGAEPPSAEKAKKAVAKFYQENGVDGVEPSILDEFPGA